MLLPSLWSEMNNVDVILTQTGSLTCSWVLVMCLAGGKMDLTSFLCHCRGQC